MTIGYILDDTLDRSDGVQQAAIAVGEYMRSVGHEVHYIVAETKRTDLENVQSIGTFLSLSFNGNSVRTPWPASRRAIKDLFNEIDFDVLHVHMPYSPFLAARVLKSAPPGVKKVGTFHILPITELLRQVRSYSGRCSRQHYNSSIHATQFPSRR